MRISNISTLVAYKAVKILKRVLMILFSHSLTKLTIRLSQF